MASQQQEIASTCLVCLEMRPLKIVGKCNHSFCTECLSRVFGSQESGSEVFACPSCQVDCPRPRGGVNGLPYFTRDSENSPDTDTEPPVVLEKNMTKCKGQGKSESAVDILCDICDDTRTKIEAINVCTECNNLHVCKDCSNTHRTNKATRTHLLTPLISKTEANETMCKLHQKLLISFCQTCGKEACNICVSVQHGDHEVDSLADTIRSNVEVVKATLELREVKLKEMLELQKELTLLKGMAQIVDKQDILIEDIEDHGEECIKQIINWKEDLKMEVKLKYKIIRDIPECLEEVCEVVQKLQPPTERAAQLLSSDTDHSPVYLEKLKTMQGDLEAIATTGDNVKGRELQKLDNLNMALDNLNMADYYFAPEFENQCKDYGQIIRPAKAVVELNEFVEHEMAVGSVDTFIPCVAVLDHRCYAVAHPVKANQPADAIDIYELPGYLKNTLCDHVPPLYDMTSTPDGRLAALSKGSTSTCSVKLFDAETGYIRSTQDIEVAKPLSLGVAPQNRYVILGENGRGEKEITIVDNGGVVELKHLINRDLHNTEYCTRITCGGRFIFVKGDEASTVVVYDKRDTGLKKLSISPSEGIVKDVTATIWDQIILSNVIGDVNSHNDSVYLTSLHYDENETPSWRNSKYKEVRRNVLGVDQEARVSTRDGHVIAVSHGRTVTVYH